MRSYTFPEASQCHVMILHLTESCKILQVLSETRFARSAPLDHFVVDSRPEIWTWHQIEILSRGIGIDPATPSDQRPSTPLIWRGGQIL